VSLQARLQHRVRSARIQTVYTWLRINKIKGFYSILDNTQFENGAKALLQTAGIGKLSPNVVMMGYKNDWRTCSGEELLAYFNVLQYVQIKYFRVKMAEFWVVVPLSTTDLL
jgi:solute carrier family 12 sodium/potassium/chloride transporter 2